MGAAGGCSTQDQMGQGIWGVPAEVTPNAVIVLRIYEIKVRQIRTQQQLLRISDYDLVVERVKDYEEERVKEVIGQRCQGL